MNILSSRCGYFIHSEKQIANRKLQARESKSFEQEQLLVESF